MAEKKDFKENIIGPMNRFKYSQFNFDEALSVCHDLWQKNIPDHLEPILNNPKVEAGSNPFWIYLAGLKRFIA